MGKSKEVKKKRKYSKVSIFHYVRLVYRSIFFILGVFWYLFHRLNDINIVVRDLAIEIKLDWVLNIMTIVFVIEMIIRLLPSELESPGCQKHFKKNYVPTGDVNVVLHDNHASTIVALLWIVGNLIFGGLHLLGIFDDGIMWLICLAYGICDMICILFFCPFQTWFLKNKCCMSCRIYNWDFPMMFTPLFFVPGIRTWGLLGIAIIILFKWELTVWRYPERFSENTNDFLKCANCNEKLCAHKKQLNSFRRSLADYADKRVQRILQTDIVKNIQSNVKKDKK